MFDLIFTVIMFIGTLFFGRILIIQAFKISYYEQKLINRGVDISHIVNITLKEVLN